eukprot:3840869-Rhodomonas_salina.1
MSGSDFCSSRRRRFVLSVTVTPSSCTTLCETVDSEQSEPQLTRDSELPATVPVGCSVIIIIVAFKPAWGPCGRVGRGEVGTYSVSFFSECHRRRYPGHLPVGRAV